MKTQAEVWKPIPDYESLYEASSFGNIRSLGRTVYTKYFRNGQYKPGKILHPTKNKVSGYMSVMLTKDGKHIRCYVHRLVASAFLPNPNNLPQVNHKDQNRQNNAVSNLEWCSISYNSTYADAIDKHRESFLKTGYTKKIYQYTLSGELVGIYRNGEEAARATGLQGRCIRQATTGISSLGYKNNNQYRGYIWLNHKLLPRK